MVFASLNFLCVFFPLCMLAYFFAKDIKQKNAVLLVFSLVFYAWGEPVYILLLLFMSFCDWFFALLIEQNRDKKKLILVLTCIVNLGIIGIFKYGGFTLQNVQGIFGVPEKIPNIILPIGISFYTFQLLSYVIDVYRGDVKAQKKYGIVLLYASLFHQCIAGPIVRYKDVELQLLSRRTNVNSIHKGINRFCVGLAKKAVVANMCGKLFELFVVSDSLINSAEAVSIVSKKSAASLWLGMLMFSMQIYLDFSAYSDMAIGMGKMIGLEYKENFDYPYLSRSVSEFWRRWHISLGTFFRDYVYFPLGGSRKGKGRTILNLFVVWALTGLWHGASWNYVLWGLYFFVFIALEKLFFGKALQKLPVISNLYLLLIVYFGWVLFKFENMSVMSAVLKGMFCLNKNAANDFETVTLLKGNLIFIIAAIIACTPLISFISKKIKFKDTEKRNFSLLYGALSVALPPALIILSLINIVGSSYNPFLYFQF
ncbi:MAG: MBOAT family protein [Oscillospiraceae bacterium]|nr:MBOAT family protein [Oscillospiraceae bacterium]